MSEHPKESGHWYKRTGEPCHEIMGKSGMRPTTLRDARKEKLVPSVTEIIKLSAKPGLQNWIIDQTILSCLTMPRIENEPETDYIARLKKDSQEQARKAAERGTHIHAVVQGGFDGKLKEAEAGDDLDFYLSARKTLYSECSQIQWFCETSFATERYGGKCDLHNGQYLIDIKTTDKDISTVKTWEEHAMQLAAYDRGLGGPPRKCGILYVHSHTAESRLIWIDDDEIEKGWKCFNALLDYFYAKTGLGTI